MTKFSVNISYFHWFSSIFGIFWHFFVIKKVMTQLITDDGSFFSLSTYTLNRLFNGCIKLYWYKVSCSWNMKKKGGDGQFEPPPREKTAFKKPSLIRVKILKKDFCRAAFIHIFYCWLAKDPLLLIWDVEQVISLRPMMKLWVYLIINLYEWV